MKKVAQLPAGRGFLNNRDAATFLALSPRTLDRARAEGFGPRFHKFGTKVVYAIADLEAWAATRSRAGTDGSR